MQSSKMRSVVSDPRRPIFFSFLPRTKPGVSLVITNRVIPSCAFALSVQVTTVKISPVLPCVMNLLFPFMMYPPFFFTAAVFMLDTSEPASGSVIAVPPSTEPSAKGLSHFTFCSWVPIRVKVSVTKAFAAMMWAVDAHTRATSSITRASDRSPAPVPPYASGQLIPNTPCPSNISLLAQGNSSLSSISAALGANSFKLIFLKVLFNSF